LQNKNTSNIILNLLILGLLLISFIGIFIPLYFGRTNLLILGSYLIVPIFFALVFYLFKRNIVIKEIFGSYNIKVYNIAFFLVYLLSVGLLFIFDLRNIFYYFSISVLAVIVFLEILNLNITIGNRNLILTQISFLVLNIIYSVTLKYDYFIGRTDLTFHVSAVTSLLENNFITDALGIYTPFPPWFIINDVFIKLSGINIPTQKVMFFLSGITYCIIIIIIFILCKYVTNNVKLSLLATLLVGIFPDFIFMGMYSIPRSIAILFELLLLMYLLKPSGGKSIAMSLFLTFTILIFHTVSILFIMVIIVSIMAVMKFYGVKFDNNLNYKYLIISGIIILSYWVFNAGPLFTRVISNAGSLLSPATLEFSGANKFSTTSSSLTEVINYIQYAILFFFIIIGNLYILKDSRYKYFVKSLVILGLAFVAISFPGPISILSTISNNTNITRFSEQSFLFTNLAAAVGLFYLYRRPSRALKIVLTLAFIILVFFSSSNDFVASDNPLVKRDFYTFYFTNVEINSFRYVGNHSLGIISTDYVALRFIDEQGISRDVSTIRYDDIENVLFKGDQNDLTLIRISEAIKRPLHLYTNYSNVTGQDPSTTGRLDYYVFDSRFQSNLSNRNLVFNSDDVMTFN
jgi:hypothetical protein